MIYSFEEWMHILKLTMFSHIGDIPDDLELNQEIKFMWEDGLSPSSPLQKLIERQSNSNQ